jgi:hypothetical protein
MSNRRNSNEPEPTGAIHLRQTVQVTLADQTRTLEIDVTLPSGASADEIERTLRQAELGMRGISSQLERHITTLKDQAGGNVVEAAQAPAQIAEPSPNANIAAAPPPSDVAEPTVPAAAPPEPAPTLAPLPAVKKASAPMTPPMSTAAFLKAAKELGYAAQEAQHALGVESLTGIDLNQALVRLHALQQAARSPQATVGFAEEVSPYDPATEEDEAALLAAMVGDDGPDEPDFGPVPEDHTPDEGDDAPTSQAQAQAQRQQEAAAQRLRNLRSLRGGGPLATPEQRQSLVNCVISPLGNDTAQELVRAIWNLAPGEKLNAARTRQLVEWSKEDDYFEETAALVIALAHQRTPAGD